MQSRTGIRPFVRELRRQWALERRGWWAICIAADYAHNSVRVLSPGLHWTEITPRFWLDVSLFARSWIAKENPNAG